MDASAIAPTVDHSRASTPVRQPSGSLDERDPTLAREQQESTPVIAVGCAAVRRSLSPHRSHAADAIRQIGQRTEAALRRELDRFFAARPDLSRADKAVIAQAMSRFRNQLVKCPRRTLSAAAGASYPTNVCALLDAVGRLFGAADAPASRGHGFAGSDLAASRGQT
jgi:hypothetical protein